MYTNILIAVDLSPRSNQVIEKAQTAASNSGHQLHLVHVVEPLGFANSGDVPIDFSGVLSDLQKHAQQRLLELGAQHSIVEDNIHLLVGKAESEIHRLTKELNADLIVVGSTGRHGIALLFGSITDGVVNSANCDVLAVRIL